MREATGPATQVLRPVLDTYRSSAVAVVGCHAGGIQRPSCELDVVVVAGERRPPSTLRIGDVFIDLFFASEKEVLKPTSPEHAVSLAHAKTVRDTSLVLSTSLASNLAVLSASSKRSSNQRLAAALKSLGRAEEALVKGATLDADYWAMSAAYDCAYSWLYSRETSPSPSHLLQQLKGQSKGALRTFEAFSKGAGLESASRANCRARLEAVAVLYDVLGGGHEGAAPVRPIWSKVRLDCVGSKAAELGQRVEHAECYSYLGTESLNALRDLAAREGGASRKPAGPASLAGGERRLLGERLLRDLGLVRDRRTIREAVDLLKSQVSGLARKS
jgi:hypothetical protein